MASGFWYLKDGRGFARQWAWMTDMLEEILTELKLDKEATAFAEYLNRYIPTEEHEYNGHGGFFHKETEESMMLWIDFREFTPRNQELFWKAAQKRVGKLIAENKASHDEYREYMIFLLTQLLDMNKRAGKGEDPMKLNHMTIITPPTGIKSGPGWQES
ncbi:MAG: hypothetical protein V4581_17275 [Bacteroidota bacterium]